MSREYVRYPKMYGGEYEVMREYGSLLQASAVPGSIAMGASIGGSVFAQQQKAKRKVKKRKPAMKRKKTTKKR